MPVVTADPNAVLWRACLAGEASVIDNLIQHGADPHSVDRNGEGCVHMCVRGGDVTAMRAVLRHRVPMDTMNHNGQTPLHIAVGQGHTDLMTFMLQQEGSLDLRSKFSGMTALHLSCLKQEQHMVTALLDRGANCAMKDAINKYADAYTQDTEILAAFNTHFLTCSHGRRKSDEAENTSSQSKTNTKLADQHTSDTSTSDRPQADMLQQHNHHEDGNDNESNDDDDNVVNVAMKERRSKRKKRRSASRKRDRGEIQHKEGSRIHNKMEHYDVDRAQQNWATDKRGGKKIQINHSLGFSDEHKQRMSQNVFDRLMGGGAARKKAQE